MCKMKKNSLIFGTVKSGCPAGILSIFLHLSYLLLLQDFQDLPRWTIRTSPWNFGGFFVFRVTVAETLLHVLSFLLLHSGFFYYYFWRFCTAWVFCSWLFACIDLFSTPNADLCQACSLCNNHRVCFFFFLLHFKRPLVEIFFIHLLSILVTACYVLCCFYCAGFAFWQFFFLPSFCLIYLTSNHWALSHIRWHWQRGVCAGSLSPLWLNICQQPHSPPHPFKNGTVRQSCSPKSPCTKLPDFHTPFWDCPFQGFIQQPQSVPEHI